MSGIGAKTAYKLSKKLGITKARNAIKRLEKAIDDGEVSKLESFGEESAKSLKLSIKEVKERKIRILLPYAEQIAQNLIAYLKENKNVIRADPLGSLRRKASTVGDVDIAVATKNPGEVIDYFVNYPKKTRILEKGDRTASIIIPGGRQIDLMVQEPESYGSLLQHFTGSKHHNIALREYANKKGFSLSEYGIRKIRNPKSEIRKFKHEKQFYDFLDLEWIPPELREDAGEIDAAVNHKIPKLLELKDIKSDLQIHSDFDIETSHDLGVSSMKDIVKTADELGYEYIAFTEHNPSQRGHDEKQTIELIKKKKYAIEQLNYSIKKDKYKRIKKVFNSLEIDILPNGNLPVPEEGLRLLDFALVSIHSSFKLNRKNMTKRVLSAFKHPKVQIFAHPTARILNKREGIELNWEIILEFCKNSNKWIEINADPARLDLPDFLVKDAVDCGVQLSLGTDAHSEPALANMKYGVYVARRGWATKKDIINTRSLDEFEKLLQS